LEVNNFMHAGLETRLYDRNRQAGLKTRLYAAKNEWARALLFPAG
jgi:hypothetical protein